jgi:hypothetical protein
VKRGQLVAGIVLLVMAAAVYLFDQSSDSNTLSIVLVGLGITLIFIARKR